MEKKQGKGDFPKVRSWLIDVRTGAGMTQGQAADAAGISQPSYCDIENGKINPKPETAKRIGAALGFSWIRFYEEGAEA